MKLLPWAERQKTGQDIDIYRIEQPKEIGPGDYKTQIEIENEKKRRKFLKMPQGAGFGSSQPRQDTKNRPAFQGEDANYFESSVLKKTFNKMLSPPQNKKQKSQP